jgi:quinol monooxygenase YgiN
MKATILFALLSIAAMNVLAQRKKPLVRIAHVEVDPKQLQVYLELLKEEISTAVKIEPGVISISAVADKAALNRVTLLEVYSDKAAYLLHCETPHFKKYKTQTADMVRSLQLIDTEPILLAKK